MLFFFTFHCKKAVEPVTMGHSEELGAAKLTLIFCPLKSLSGAFPQLSRLSSSLGQPLLSVASSDLRLWEEPGLWIREVILVPSPPGPSVSSSVKWELFPTSHCHLVGCRLWNLPRGAGQSSVFTSIHVSLFYLHLSAGHPVSDKH